MFEIPVYREQKKPLYSPRYRGFFLSLVGTGEYYSSLILGIFGLRVAFLSCIFLHIILEYRAEVQDYLRSSPQELKWGLLLYF